MALNEEVRRSVSQYYTAFLQLAADTALIEEPAVHHLTSRQLLESRVKLHLLVKSQPEAKGRIQGHLRSMRDVSERYSLGMCGSFTFA